MRILIVDDQNEAETIRRELEPRHIEVARASDADEAFCRWQNEGFWDMLVTEYHIKPGKRIRNVSELVKTIRAANPSQRIAIHTYDQELLAVSVPVMRKPYAIGQLLRLLRLPVLPLSPSSVGQ